MELVNKKTVQTRKRQIITLFVVLFLLAFTLFGVQAFGQDARQSMPPTVNTACATLLTASADEGIAPQADETKTLTAQLRCDGKIVTTLLFSGTETSTLMGGGGISVMTFKYDITFNASALIEQNYTNFRLMPETFLASSTSQNGIFWKFYQEGNTLGFRSGNTCATSVTSIQKELDDANAYIECDLVRAEVPLPETPTKEGHTFAGWYYGTQAQHSENCVAYSGAPIYEDTALHAHWTINTFTVTFDEAGGSEVEDKTVNWNTAVPLSTPIRIGYTFLGWYLPDGTQYTNQPIKANTALTARWQIKTFKVTFYVGEEKHAELTVEFGTVLSEAMENAHIESYKAMRMDGVRLSKQSVITEDTEVLVTKLSGWEKYGDFVARNQWYTWVIVGLGGVLLILSVVGVVMLVRR